MIRFEHVTKSYGKTTILKDLNFTIPDGQFVILIGPSGCGKTTTMKLINRLLEPDSGIISINGQDIRLQDKVELRRHIGYVIQQIGLFPNMTVAQNISVVPKLLKYDKTRCAEIVQEMLKLVRMEDYAEKYPSELSGGQQQRIGVLRALAASQTISPSMRLGFLVLPPRLLERYRRELGFYACTVPALEQHVLARFISGGHYERHLSRMRKEYRNRRAEVVEAFRSSALAPRVTFSEERAGLHFLLRLDTGRSDAELYQLAARLGVRLGFLSEYAAVPKPEFAHTLVINYAGLSPQRLPEAIRLLSEVLLPLL